MERLRLLITDNSLILSEKGRTVAEESFETDEECFAFIDSVLKKFKKRKIHCFLTGSRLVSETRFINHLEKEEFVADEKTLGIFVDAASQAFIAEHPEKDLEVVQKEVLSISLNGYAVKSLKKVRVSELSAAVFFAAIPQSLKKRLPSETVFSSFAFHQSEGKEIMQCTVYERSTDLSIKNADGFFALATLPLGTGHAASQAEKGVSPEWFQTSFGEALEKALMKLREHTILPSKIFLIAAQTSRAQFVQVFKEKGFEVADTSSILTA